MHLDDDLDLSEYDSVDDIGQPDQADDLGAEEDNGDEGTDGDDDAPPLFAFGEEDQPDAANPDAEETPLVRKLRKERRDLARELKRYQEQNAPRPIEVGPRPTYEDCDFDPDRFERETDAWIAKKTQADAEVSQQRQAEEAKTREGTQILAEYQTRAKSFAAANRISDYDDAFADVEDKLGAEKAALIIAGSPKAEELIYALHKNPKKMDALATISNLPRFMYEAATLQKDLKVSQTRKSPPADTPVRGNGSSASGDRRLAQLEVEAERTNDRRKVVAYKAALRNKN